MNLCITWLREYGERIGDMLVGVDNRVHQNRLEGARSRVKPFQTRVLVGNGGAEVSSCIG